MINLIVIVCIGIILYALKLVINKVKENKKRN